MTGTKIATPAADLNYRSGGRACETSFETPPHQLVEKNKNFCHYLLDSSV
jgi:hypothetical protein